MTVYSVVKNVLGSWHVMADGEPTGQQFGTEKAAWRVAARRVAERLKRLENESRIDVFSREAREGEE